jgi:hypothetical protein
MARIPVDMRTFRHKNVTFTPKGPVLKVGSGETPVLPNPIKRETVIPFTARLFVGLSVGQEDAWTVEDVIDITQRVRVKQGADPDASFLLQRGLYTDRAQEIVREDSVQVVIFDFGEDQEKFEGQMGDLAETLIKELKQETIYVELQKAGVPYAVLKVTG